VERGIEAARRGFRLIRSNRLTGVAMNKDQVKGRVEEAKGAVKEAAGRMTGKPELEDRGTLEKVAGKAQKTYGDVKEQVKEEWKKP
jgi:uncharacterized protein YjbJ (UPF0337 family)